MKAVGKIASDQRRPTTTRHRSEKGREGVAGIEGTVNGRRERSLNRRLMRKRKRPHPDRHLLRDLLRTTRSIN
jgi:hypothetical protein